MATKTDVLDLEAALTEFNARPELAEALKKALDANLDLAIASDETLTQVDTIQKSRLIYVVSLLKFLGFLREPATSVSKKETQSKLALAYIKHAEGMGLEKLGLGRTTADSKLEEEINILRSKLRALSDAKAETLNAQKTRT